MPCKTLPLLIDLPMKPDLPVTRSLPIYVFSLALPRCDYRDEFSNLFGFCKRVNRMPLPRRRLLFRAFRRFVHIWLRRNVKPLPNGTDISFETWLDSRPYPQTRKDELRLKWELVKDTGPFWLQSKLRKVKSFIKDESYSEYKAPRFINSRVDEFKCASGPIFSAIEKVLFELPCFIKYVPVSERPSYIEKRVRRPGWIYHSTDYTSFESLFTPRFMRACEMQLYKYMVQNLPGGESWYNMVEDVLCNLPYRVGNGVINAEMYGTRMSGEMCTSLGNGFANAMVTMFTLSMSGCPLDTCIFEGDDGLFSSPIEIDATIPTGLGLRIKIERSVELGDASFCGNVYDENDQVVVTDPKEALIDFGWTKRTDVNASQRRLDLLLRAKAYSLLYQYNGTPVLTSFASYVLRVTKRAETGLKKYACEDRTLSEWERSTLIAALDAKVKPMEPPPRTRRLVERLYHIELAEQRELEKYFDSLTKLGPIDHVIIRSWSVLKPQWEHYFTTYQEEMIIDRPRENPRLAMNTAVQNLLQLANGQRFYDG